MELSS